jgi:hypothetical protein
MIFILLHGSNEAEQGSFDYDDMVTVLGRWGYFVDVS